MPARVSADALGSYTPDSTTAKPCFTSAAARRAMRPPNQEDKTKLGGGLSLKSPFGTFTPRTSRPTATTASEAGARRIFVTAMWKGTSPDGSHYYPAFPYTSYQRMRLEDVRDLFGYLKTLPAVAKARCVTTTCRSISSFRPMLRRLEISFSRR